MPAPANAAEFFDLVQKSGVIEDARSQTQLATLRASDTLPAEPNKLAGLMIREGLLTYFQAEQFLQGRWKRFHIGRYKVLERLGAGGMGQVFLCEHKLMRRRVAVKVLPTSKAEDASSLERFYREARAVAALDHPNIVRAYDIDQDDNLHFLVMEYVDGNSLQDIVKKFGPMDVDRACNYVAQAALGLEHASESGLVHRDIKPGNLLIDRQGVMKILDMGLARFFHDEEDMITKRYDENVLGTADYLAPEQAIDSHGVDIRADIYSLGATFYYMLTSSPPFHDGTVAQKLIWHQNKTPRPIRTLRPEIPEGVAEVLERMMAKRPEDRYRTPAEVAEALVPWTSVPVPLPPEKEMPQLCQAAQGRDVSQPAGSRSGVTGVSGVVRTGRSVVPGLSPQLVAQRTPPPARPPVPPPAPPPFAPPPTPWPVPAAAVVPPPPPPPVAPPAPPTQLGDDPYQPVWESFDGSQPAPALAPPEVPFADPGDFAPPDDAPAVKRPRGGRAPARKPAGKPAPGKPRPKWLIPAAAAGGLAVLVALISLVAGGGPATPPRDPNQLTVGPPKSGAGFRKVADALEKVKSRQEIVLLADVNETVNVTGKAAIEGVVIRSADPAKPVAWSGPGTTTLLSLSNVSGWKVADIEFKGGSQVSVRVNGECRGLRLSNLTLRGGKEAALAFAGKPRGTEAEPIVVSGLRVLDAGDSAVRLADGGEHIQFEDIALSGRDTSRAGILFAGGFDKVKLDRARVFRFHAGLRLDGPYAGEAAAKTAAGLEVRASTFAQTPEGALSFSAVEMPPPGPSRIAVTLSKVLVAKSPAVVRYKSTTGRPWEGSGLKGTDVAAEKGVAAALGETAGGEPVKPPDGGKTPPQPFAVKALPEVVLDEKPDSPGFLTPAAGSPAAGAGYAPAGG